MTPTREKVAPRHHAPHDASASNARYQTALHEQASAARRLELLTEHSSDVLCELREGVITYISPNTVPISGLHSHQFVGRAFSEVVHPDDTAMLARFVVPGWTGPIEATFRVQDASGDWLWREARGVRVRDEDGTHHSILVLRDINERRRAEEALERSEARANALLTAIPDLIFRITREGQCLDFKAERDEDLYVAPELIIGANIRDLLPADLSARALVLIERAVDDGGVHTLEYSLPKQGVLRDYEARITASGDNEVVVISRDVTVRKRAEDSLRESEERYRQIIEHAAVLRERARIAEELHDTVAQVFFGIGIASKDLLGRKSPAASTVRRKLSQIQRLAADGGRQVRNAVHALSSTGPADGLDASIIRLAEALRTSTGIEVEYVRQASDLRLSAEMQIEMYRAAQEGLYNARKHSEASRVTVGLDARQGAAVLTVRDNGIGSAEAIELAVARSKGYGLRNLRHRFAQAGGCMEIFDNPHGGITVLCYLPVETAS